MDIQKMIKDQVMKAIGKLDGFKEIRISNVFDNRYRVDVWCSYKPDGCLTDFDGQKIDYSYFIRTDEDGKITYCNPELGTKPSSNFKTTKLPFRES